MFNRHAVTLAFALALASAPALADDFVWTGKSYIPIPAVFNQDIVISFPEPVTFSLQQPSAVEQKEWDDHSIILRPKVQEQDQRALIKGKKTGKTYYAKVSSHLPFVPFRNVIDGTASAQEERVAAAGNTQLGLMKAMMTPNGIPPQGFEEQTSQKVMLDMAPFKITASNVWSSPGMVGIIATLSSTIPGVTIPVVPTNIQLRVPEFGALRIMGADSWELSPTYPSTRVYLIFSR
jgi:hypothetical protein